MNLKSQALAISEFISQYTPMWIEEIMNEYPHSINNYPNDWILLLDSLSPDELYAVDGKEIIEKIKGSDFANFMQNALNLSKLPQITKSAEISLEDWAFNGVKKKKKHEIQIIVPVLKKLKDQNRFEYVVDIGGGVGHLSRVLSHYHSIPSISIDRNAGFQKNGEERLKKYRKINGSKDVTFININFGNDNDEKKLKEIFTPNSFSLGLHTCGPLANILIQKSIDHKTSGLLNFGCCYHTLNPNKDFPLSIFYRESNLPSFTLYSLTLATRSHGQMPRDDYNTKERVKYYRYALHLFLIKHFNKKTFIEVGECNIKTYWGPFSDYIKTKLDYLKIKHNFSDDDFNNFYIDLDIQKELRKMWLCNIIRWQLGRVLEIYLLIDRCLYLEEKGYDVLIDEYFKEALSPRNIGILALLK